LSAGNFLIPYTKPLETATAHNGRSISTKFYSHLKFSKNGRNIQQKKTVFFACLLSILSENLYLSEKILKVTG